MICERNVQHSFKARNGHISMISCFCIIHWMGNLYNRSNMFMLYPVFREKNSIQWTKLENFYRFLTSISIVDSL